jgi:hypothetical protein
LLTRDRGAIPIADGQGQAHDALDAAERTLGAADESVDPAPETVTSP